MHRPVVAVHIFPGFVKAPDAGAQGPLGAGDGQQAHVMLPHIHHPGAVAVAVADGMQGGAGALASHQRGLGRHHYLAGGEDAFQAHILGKIAHILVLRAQHNVLRGTDLRHLPVVHDGDAVAQFEGFVEVVGNKDDGFLELGLQAQQFVLHLPPDEGIQSAEGFVHQQDVGVHRQGAGQAHPLLHPAGELPGIGLLPAGQPHQGQHFPHPRLPFRFLDALHFQPPAGVVQHIAVGHQAVMLKHHGDFAAAELPQSLVRHSGDVIAVNDDLPGGGFNQPDEAAHHRGFAAARQPHNDESLAPVDHERNILQPDHIAQLALEKGFVLAGVFGGQGPFRVASENLPDGIDPDVGLRRAVVGRRAAGGGAGVLVAGSDHFANSRWRRAGGSPARFGAHRKPAASVCQIGAAFPKTFLKSTTFSPRLTPERR